MVEIERYDKLFVYTSFFIQIVVSVYFALRKWRFDTAMRFGWVIYALAIPAVIISLILLINDRSWLLWLAGFLYGAWAIFGYVVDIACPVAWRSPILWPVFLPYVLLYFMCLMFYWWPLANIQRPL